MPRVSRNSINSKYIHVITQGIKKEYIFQEDKYKQKYINLLNKFIQDYNSVNILAYCVMDNHTHFLVYTDKINDLSKVMSKLNTSYGMFYNNTTGRVGYVFKNRYYTQEIVDEKHLFNTLAYIHKNPVKAGIVKSESDYKYSSYCNYIEGQIKTEIIKLIFNINDKYNYLDQFYYIHENFSEENIIDIKEEQETAQRKMEKVVETFCNKYSYDLNYIKKDNYLLKSLIKEIQNNSDITNKAISEYLKIGKNRIATLINRKHKY